MGVDLAHEVVLIPAEIALEAPARRRIEPAIGRSPQTAGRDIGEKRWKEVRS
jgi:hypothetical protein